MSDIYIFALHLSFGGIEKAITNMANIFVENYRVHLMVTYQMPDAPAYALDERVIVTYLTDVVPNRKEFEAAMKQKAPFKIIKEGCKSVAILRKKKQVLKQAIRNIQDGIIITTRNEDNMMLSQYGASSVYKIAQLHQDYQSDKNMVNDFQQHYANIDVFALLTDQLRDEVAEIMKANTHTKLVSIPNFLDSLPEPVSLAIKEPYMISVGRLHQVKGFERLIRMFETIHKQLPEYKLMIIGDGELQQELIDVTHRLHLEEAIIFTGRLNSEEIEHHNQHASIYAMTSYSEGLPFVLIEACSCMLPAVAFDVRVGPRSVIEDSVNGYLIPDQDEALFIETCVTLAKDREKREAMALAAYQRAQYYTKENVKAIWYQILKEGERL